jgi:hypothetical protein
MASPAPSRVLVRLAAGTLLALTVAALPLPAQAQGGAPACPAVEVTMTQDGRFLLQWETVPGALEYRVQRATGDGAFDLLATTSGTSHHDGSAQAGVPYRYVVVAWDGAAESEGCPAHEIRNDDGTCPHAGFCPPCPSGFGTEARGDGSVHLSWGTVDPRADGIVVTRQDGGAGDFVALASLPRSATSYTDHATTPGVAYTYALLVTNEADQLHSRCLEAEATAIPDLPSPLALGLASAAGLGAFLAFRRR